jgi:hypothetical protein
MAFEVTRGTVGVPDDGGNTIGRYDTYTQAVVAMLDALDDGQWTEIVDHSADVTGPNLVLQRWQRLPLGSVAQAVPERQRQQQRPFVVRRNGESIGRYDTYEAAVHAALERLDVGGSIEMADERLLAGVPHLKLKRWQMTAPS